MSKNEFTNDEYNQILKLVQMKVVADTDTQKKIRRQIRNIGFRWSGFSSRRGTFDIEGVENLLANGTISVIDEPRRAIDTLDGIPQKCLDKTAIPKMAFSKVTIEIFTNGIYNAQSQLNPEVLKSTGLYGMRLKKGSKLPLQYQKRLEKRPTKIIYIGKAQGQSLGKRLDQELRHTSPGTFFRSIGAVLGYRPISGSLRNSANKKNYKFSDSDTRAIIEWLDSNIEVCVTAYAGDFSIENKIIAKYSPLLNHTGNPNKCQQLMEDRALCRRIATEQKLDKNKLHNK